MLPMLNAQCSMLNVDSSKNIIFCSGYRAAKIPGRRRTCSWGSPQRRWRRPRQVRWSSALAGSVPRRAWLSSSSARSSCPSRREPWTRHSRRSCDILECALPPCTGPSSRWHGAHRAQSHRVGNPGGSHTGPHWQDPCGSRNSRLLRGSHHCIQIRRSSSRRAGSRWTREHAVPPSSECKFGPTWQWQHQRPSRSRNRPGLGSHGSLDTLAISPWGQNSPALLHHLHTKETVDFDKRKEYIMQEKEWSHQARLALQEVGACEPSGGRPSESSGSCDWSLGGSCGPPSKCCWQSWSSQWSGQRGRGCGGQPGPGQARPGGAPENSSWKCPFPPGLCDRLPALSLCFLPHSDNSWLVDPCSAGLLLAEAWQLHMMTVLISLLDKLAFVMAKVTCWGNMTGKRALLAQHI